MSGLDLRDRLHYTRRVFLCTCIYVLFLGEGWRSLFRAFPLEEKRHLPRISSIIQYLLEERCRRTRSIYIFHRPFGLLDESKEKEGVGWFDKSPSVSICNPVIAIGSGYCSIEKCHVKCNVRGRCDIYMYMQSDIIYFEIKSKLKRSNLVLGQCTDIDVEHKFRCHVASSLLHLLDPVNYSQNCLVS